MSIMSDHINIANIIKYKSVCVRKNDIIYRGKNV